MGYFFDIKEQKWNTESERSKSMRRGKCYGTKTRSWTQRDALFSAEKTVEPKLVESKIHAISKIMKKRSEQLIKPNK